MMTFNQAEALFKTARNKYKGKPLKRNTRLMSFEDDLYYIQLYNTIIVRIYKNGLYVLNTGGLYTRTTKDRINTYGPVTVHQSKGKWLVRQGLKVIPFVDYMGVYGYTSDNPEINSLDNMQRNENNQY